MRFRLFIFAALFCFGLQLRAAISCETFAKYFAHPNVRNNAHFWEEYSKVADQGTDQDIINLLKKFKAYDGSSGGERLARETATGREVSSFNARSVPTAPAFELNITAAKELRNLQPSIRNKADEFLNLAKGGPQQLYTKLRENQGRWQLEKLRGDQGMSVRLNDGYRVVFRERENHNIEILNFSKTATHGGH